MMPDTLASLFSVSPQPVTSSPLANIPIGTLISTRIAADAAAQLKETFIDTLKELRTEALGEALDTRNAADAEFLEELSDYRLELVAAKDDGITEIQDQLATTLEKLDEETAGIVGEAEAEILDRVEWVCTDACDRLDKIASVKESAFLQRIEKTGQGTGQDSQTDRNRRGASLPTVL